MRILQLVTRSEFGGAQSIVASLSSELAARGHEVAIASGPEGDGEAWERLSPTIQRFEVEGLLRDISPRHEIRALRGIAALYREWKPDLVHLHTSKAAFLGRLARGIPVARIVYTMHGYDQLRVANRKFLALDKALRRRCGAIVAVSRHDKDAMEADGYKVALVRNGCPDARLEKANDEALVARLIKLRATHLPLVIVLARNSPPKRIDLARETARVLRGRANIAWIGGGPTCDDPPNFVALGHGSGMSAYLRFADIYLLLSDHEGLSLSLIEAMSSGLPCVVSAIGGCLEVLGLDRPGECPYGIAVRNDVSNIAAAIAELCVSSSQREAMGRMARLSWTADYSIDSMVQGYLEIYNRLYPRPVPDDAARR